MLMVDPSEHTLQRVVDDQYVEPRQRATAVGLCTKFAELPASNADTSSKFSNSPGTSVPDVRTVYAGRVADVKVPVPEKSISPQHGMRSAPMVSSAASGKLRPGQQSSRGVISMKRMSCPPPRSV